MGQPGRHVRPSVETVPQSQEHPSCVHVTSVRVGRSRWVVQIGNPDSEFDTFRTTVQESEMCVRAFIVMVDTDTVSQFVGECLVYALRGHDVRHHVRFCEDFSGPIGCVAETQHSVPTNVIHDGSCFRDYPWSLCTQRNIRRFFVWIVKWEDVIMHLVAFVLAVVVVVVVVQEQW